MDSQGIFAFTSSVSWPLLPPSVELWECTTGEYFWVGRIAQSDEHFTFDMYLPLCPQKVVALQSHLQYVEELIASNLFQIWGPPDFKSMMAIVKNFKIWKNYEEKNNQIDPPLQNNPSAYIFNFWSWNNYRNNNSVIILNNIKNR